MKNDFGVGMSMPVKPEIRSRAEDFCSNILGLPKVLDSEQYTCFKFPNGQILGITSEENAPTEEDYRKSLWLEIVTTHFLEMTEKIKNFGVTEVEGGMKEAFFFHIPGGSVFRLLSVEMAKNQEM